MYQVTHIKCPSCRTLFEIRFFNFCSGLGPPLVRCGSCRKNFSTGREEFPQMDAGRLVLFFAVSLVYVVMLGLIGGNFLDGIYQMMHGAPKIENFRVSTTSFRQAAAISAGVVVFIQAYRVFFSFLRAKTGKTLSATQHWLGLEMNMQIKCLAILVLMWAGAKALYRYKEVPVSPTSGDNTDSNGTAPGTDSDQGGGSPTDSNT